MRTRPFLLAVVGLAALARADDKPKAFTNVGDANADVAVLNVLHILQPTPAQLKALRDAAPKTMQKPPPRKLVKVSDALRASLTALRDALAADDDDKIDEHFKKFDELRQKENPEVDEVEITDSARERAPAFVKSLSARQVAIYAASAAEYLDPLERLTDAMFEGRKLKPRERLALRDEVAEQLGWLVAGLDAKAEEKVRARALALIDKAHKPGDKAFAKQREALEKEARDLVAPAGPMDVIRHFLERVVAETMSSHRLEAAIEQRSRKK